MLKVGLTGGIGSGKSTVAKIFELLDVPVYYADAASKRLYHTDAHLMQQMKDHFGTDVYTHGLLNRAKLSEVVFNNPEKLALLNSLVHPPTLRDAAAWMAQQKTPYSIKEAALLFETGSASGLDCIIGVSAPQSLRIKRVMNRDGLSRAEVLQRLHRQVPEEIKMKLCDYVIINNEQQAVIPQVLALHQQLLQRAKESTTSVLSGPG